ncbi:class I SAM-dependent methyltransferase [Arthrobacter zhaoguopingii]|uniref:class I SAM-dependent methyltransferase n=1 Tax=Arthrobacter zhaoguopingii TaxID=2681491 RepID=UPI0013577AFB|nr:class I SAM-dependent methyltransferase [Arthrobacter zhaoguopingii]
MHFHLRAGKPVGAITRGTTNPNRLRRVDRWLAGPQAWRLRRAEDPLVVDLGYGAAPVTAVELFGRLRRVRPDSELIGIEIDPARVEAARPLERAGLSFRQGGFEVPVAGRRPVLVRAFNVLRQYDEEDYLAHWDTVRSRLSEDGLFIDGTCDEIGRRSTWAAIDRHGPVSLSISMRFGAFSLPSDVAERLPKALIHRNVPGENIHRFLLAMDRAWLDAAPLAAFGARQRWTAMCAALAEAGWPLLDSPSRWRLGEVTVAWSAVEPAGTAGLAA